MGIISSSSTELDNQLTLILSEIETKENLSLDDVENLMNSLVIYKGKTSKVLKNVAQERKINIGKKILDLMTFYQDYTKMLEITKAKLYIEKLFPDEKIRAESAYLYYSSCIGYVLGFGEESGLDWLHYSFQYGNNWISNQLKDEMYYFRKKYGVHIDGEDDDDRNWVWF